MKKVGEKTFKKFVWIAMSTLFALTAFLGYKALGTEFDYDFEKFFPVNDKETDFFFEHREQFESDNDFLMIAVENDEGVFDKEFLQEFDKFTREVDTSVHVQFASSVTTMEETFIFANGFTSSKPYIDFEDFDSKRDSTRIFEHKELINSLVADDAKSMAIFVRHDDYLSKQKSDVLIRGLEKLIDQHEFDNVRMAGRTVGQNYYIDSMTAETIMFVGLSGVLIIFFLLIAFRSGWGISIPLIVIMTSMLWVIGLMGVFKEPMNIMLVVLPSIMFVVSMSDVIHLVSRYLDALRTEDTVFKAIKVAVREVGMATLLTSITTAVGFFSLYFVRVQPIQVFGVVMGFGVLIAFGLTFLALPCLFYIFPGPKYVREKKRENFWSKYLAKWFLWVMRKRNAVLYAGIALVVLSIVGATQLRSNNYLLDDLRPSSQLKQDFNFLDDHYGGVRSFELAISIDDTTKTVWDKDILAQIDSVENYLEKDYGVTVKTSLVSLVKALNRSSHAGNADYYELPTKTRKLKQFRRALRIANEGQFYNSIVDSNERVMRINGSLPDLGNQVVKKKNDGFAKFVKQFEGSGVNYQITGTAHLIDKNLSYLASSLVRGLGVSILIVAIIIGLIYKSPRMLLISIVPNVIPLIFIAGVMGLMGIELKTSTSIIFTIAFGIAVDDTIHFLGKYKFELMKGKGKLYALKRSYMTTGKAMILTTLILCAGFLLLIFSSFLGTFYMGILLCLTLFVALVADLTLLPVLLLLFYNPKTKPKKAILAES